MEEEPKAKKSSFKVVLIIALSVIAAVFVFRLTDTLNAPVPNVDNSGSDAIDNSGSYNYGGVFVDDIVVNKPRYEDNFPTTDTKATVYTNKHFLSADTYTIKSTGLCKKIGTYNSITVTSYAYKIVNGDKVLLGTNSILLTFSYLNEVKAYEITYETTEKPTRFEYRLSRS